MKSRKTANVSTWVFHTFFFYKENIFRKLFPLMIVLALYCLLVNYLNYSSIFIANIIEKGLEQFHMIFSFILAFFISFRVNTSYNRWWEARTLWGGIVNNSRNLALKFEVYVGLDKYPEFTELVAHYPRVLKLHLRSNHEAIAELFAQYGYHCDTLDNPMVVLNHKMYIAINDLRKEELISLEQYLMLDQHVANLMDLTGGCERILKTPPPPAFSFLARQALLCYALIFPFGWVDIFGLISIPLLLIIVYVLFGLEVLAEEMEDPFGYDDHDLPLANISKNISNNVHSIARYKQT